MTSRIILIQAFAGILILFCCGCASSPRIKKSAVRSHQQEFLKIVERKKTPSISSKAYAHYSMGMIYDNEGNPSRAVEEYLKAIESDPEAASVYYRLGASYVKIGKILYLDFGLDSDLHRIKRIFPETTRTVFYRLTGKEPQDVVEDLQLIRRSDSCSRIYLSAIGADTPVSLVRHFFDNASRIWNKPLPELLAEPPNY